MPNTLELVRKASYDQLVDIVAANHAVGRRSYGASLKPELKRRTEGTFDETDLGFASFGAFLQAAAGAGAIDLYKAPRGPDWLAVPKGADPLPEPVPNEMLGFSNRLRPDIWSCLIDWRQGMRRVYHRATDRAYLFPEVARVGERPEDVAHRRLYEANPSEYVEITPISFDTQVAWMREFAEGVEDTAAREVLLFALGRDRPAREFTDALRSKPGLLRSWRVSRIRRVVDLVTAWATENELSLNLYEKPSEADHEASAERGTGSNGDDLRRILHRAIDRMPESELMRISLPVEYLLGD